MPSPTSTAASTASHAGRDRRGEVLGPHGGPGRPPPSVGLRDALRRPPALPPGTRSVRAPGQGTARGRCGGPAEWRRAAGRRAPGCPNPRPVTRMSTAPHPRRRDRDSRADTGSRGVEARGRRFDRVGRRGCAVRRSPVRPIVRCGPSGHRRPRLASIADHGSVTRRASRSPSGALPDRRPEGICGSTSQARAPSAPRSVAAPLVCGTAALAVTGGAIVLVDGAAPTPPRHHGVAAAAHGGPGRGPGRGAGRAGDRRAARRRRRRPRQRRAPGRGAGAGPRPSRPQPAARPRAANQCGPRGDCGIATSGLGAVKPHVRAAAQFLGCRFGEPTMYGVAGRAGTSDHPSGPPSTSWSTAPPATGSPRAP